MNKTPTATPGRPGLSRRDLLKVVAVGGAVAALPLAVAAQQSEAPVAPGGAAVPASPAADAQPAQVAAEDLLFFFNDEEAAMVEAIIDRLIPADPDWPGAVGAGVLTYIDRQLAGPWGQGARAYLAGPWSSEALPEQGYQLRFTPSEVVRFGLADLRAHVAAAGGGELWDLGAGPMDELLTQLEEGGLELPNVPGGLVFELLHELTVQGFFADPAHGGNRGMVAWKMIGFPGAYAQYLELVDVHNLPYDRDPISIADTEARAAHLAHGH